MMLDATQKYAEPLTKERLFGWHAALFPTRRSGMRKITVGAWRTDEAGPMQVASGPIGREKVHYEAPAAPLLDDEMQAFLDWYNAEDDIDPVVKAAIAHLWFVTIHPFDDGNGRIARAITDMSLARSEGSSQRHYRMSAQIRLERNAYYAILEQIQKGELDITPWLQWFLDCLNKAIDGAQNILAAVLRKAEFWKNTPPRRLTRASATSSIACLTALSANSPVRNGQSLKTRPPTPRCATSTTLSPVASCSAMQAAGAARVIRWQPSDAYAFCV
jgi:Fic family protein